MHLQSLSKFRRKALQKLMHSFSMLKSLGQIWDKTNNSIMEHISCVLDYRAKCAGNNNSKKNGWGNKYSYSFISLIVLKLSFRETTQVYWLLWDFWTQSNSLTILAFLYALCKIFTFPLDISYSLGTIFPTQQHASEVECGNKWEMRKKRWKWDQKEPHHHYLNDQFTKFLVHIIIFMCSFVSFQITFF